MGKERFEEPNYEDERHDAVDELQDPRRNRLTKNPREEIGDDVDDQDSDGCVKQQDEHREEEGDHDLSGVGSGNLAVVLANVTVTAASAEESTGIARPRKL